ncbi:MAG: GNAT family N-acetyltransferase [candidate division Zixibacteria bacterium]|nr:GNAT family N-acetyltransferase [candidate division Zixibacteria bacterium]
MFDIIVGVDSLTKESVLELYKKVGWIKYTENPDDLFKAILNSTYVVTIQEKDDIIGLARCMSDDISINYLQDILVDPDYQKKGIGRKLLENCLERFKHVRSHVILTDDEKRQRLFYESLGYKNTKEFKKMNLNCFVKMTGVELE